MCAIRTPTPDKETNDAECDKLQWMTSSVVFFGRLFRAQNGRPATPKWGGRLIFFFPTFPRRLFNCPRFKKNFFFLGISGSVELGNSLTGLALVFTILELISSLWNHYFLVFTICKKAYAFKFALIGFNNKNSKFYKRSIAWKIRICYFFSRFHRSLFLSIIDYLIFFVFFLSLWIF